MHVILLLASAVLAAGCSGGGNKDSRTSNPPSSGTQGTAQSAGGIWSGFPAVNESITLYIAETGELMAQTATIGTTPPTLAFGTGAVIVNNPNDVAGTYRLRSLPSGPIFGLPSEKTCAMDGTVTERSLLQVDISCTDSAGATTNQTVTLLYNPAYELDSSLAEIAGNYTVPFRPQTNTLNINASGVVFGMLDNGLNCTVNGQVQVIDAHFNLYRFQIQLSLCQGIVGQSYEGAIFRGLAARNLPGMPAGAFLLLLSGAPNSFVIGPIPPIPSFQFFSLLYERV
jgi:hypothetical protein